MGYITPSMFAGHGMPCPYEFDYNRATSMQGGSSVPRRKSVRLRTVDYSQPGRYFLTICTRNKKALLSEVIGHDVRLSPIGQIVDRCWLEIPAHFPQAQLITHIIMPDHLHGIILIRQEPPNTVEGQPRDFAKPVGGSIATIVGAFKSAASKRLGGIPARGEDSIWQRGYYEHIIRSDRELANACEYIRMNPARYTFKREP